jgi:hypothetical protein
MLGQHPQMHGLPETHLFSDEVLERWLRRASQETYRMKHGLLRAVAQLCFGEQSESSVKLAAGWLTRRASFTSGMIMEELARRAIPAILVDKSPSLVYGLDAMQRVHRFFPAARFIHLTRHPRGHGYSVLKYLQMLTRPEYRPREGGADVDTVPEWVRTLAAFPYPSAAQDDGSESSEDPQCGWFVLNTNIVTFLKSIPHHQWTVVHGEDLLGDPDRCLRQVAAWLGLRTDQEAVEEMKHPERSPYACFGPPGARLGNDILFLENPSLHQVQGHSYTLEGPLSWRRDGAGFLPEVKELAQALGYS